jgi:hypothetical protein
MVLVRILMSKSGFKDEVLIKLIVGLHNNFDPLAGKRVFSAAKAAENTLFSCRRTVNK